MSGIVILQFVVADTEKILTKKFQNQSNYKERLSSLLNDTSDQSIQNAGMILSKIKDNVYSFEMTVEKLTLSVER